MFTCGHGKITETVKMKAEKVLKRVMIGYTVVDDAEVIKSHQGEVPNWKARTNEARACLKEVKKELESCKQENKELCEEVQSLQNQIKITDSMNIQTIKKTSAQDKMMSSSVVGSIAGA